MYSVDERKVSRRRGAFTTYYVKRAANRRHVQSSWLTRSRDTRDDSVGEGCGETPDWGIPSRVFIRVPFDKDARVPKVPNRPAVSRRSLINALADRISI